MDDEEKTDVPDRLCVNMMKHKTKKWNKQVHPWYFFLADNNAVTNRSTEIHYDIISSHHFHHIGNDTFSQDSFGINSEENKTDIFSTSRIRNMQNYSRCVRPSEGFSVCVSGERVRMMFGDVPVASRLVNHQGTETVEEIQNPQWMKWA